MLVRAVVLLGRRGGGSGSGGGGSGSRRLFSSAAEEEMGSLPLGFPAICIWGSNTGVGKTLFSAGLAAAARRAGLPVLYLKPAQTGFPTDSDARLVGAAAGLPLAAGPHAAALDSQLLPASAAGSADGTINGGSLAKTLYAWAQPISPHLAVEREGRHVSDRQVAADVAAELRAFAAASAANHGRGLAIVETAGGVASPGPSGTLQSELLRALSLPALLVGDGRLGGISATLSAYDSLALRGHQVPFLALMDDGRLDNAAALQRHLGRKAAVFTFPVCEPPPADSNGQGSSNAAAAGGIDANLAAWLADSRPQFDGLLGAIAEAHSQRVGRLAEAAADAKRMLWWPFTQHGNVSGVTVIDSRVGESFSVYRPSTQAAGAAGAAPSQPAEQLRGAAASSVHHNSTAGNAGGGLELLYDSCASWWTQGVSQQAHTKLVQAVGAAAARYGHVMFPENAHEPAVELARKLLSTVGRGWASRVFYSDNGSTAIEVALKMAFRKYMSDHGLLPGSEAAAEGQEVELEVLGLTEGYHGDTLGAMEAVAPSPFNGPLQTPWYRGRGLFLDPPTVALQHSMWHVRLPEQLQQAAAAQAGPSDAAPGLAFGSQAALFDLASRMAGTAGDSRAAPPSAQAQSALYAAYLSHISSTIEGYLASGGGSSSASSRQQTHLGACILEPVLQGAGGMRLIDPLFQRAVVEVCRQRRIPVLLDEVFTGFWRLGVPSGACLLGVTPDVACYAKLMTGGLVPLAATLATEEVFSAFEGDSKVRALLHGHSYTAHPIGCAAGVAALELYRDTSLNPNWQAAEEAGQCRCLAQRAAAAAAPQEGAGSGCAQTCGRILPLWDEQRVAALSCHPRVKGVVPLGTVLAVQLRAEGASGYASNAAAEVVARLRGMGVYGRPLGDVVYLMVTPMTERRQCDALLAKLAAALG